MKIKTSGGKKWVAVDNLIKVLKKSEETIFNSIIKDLIKELTQSSIKGE